VAKTAILTDQKLEEALRLAKENVTCGVEGECLNGEGCCIAGRGTGGKRRSQFCRRFGACEHKTDKKIINQNVLSKSLAFQLPKKT